MNLLIKYECLWPSIIYYYSKFLFKIAFEIVIFHIHSFKKKDWQLNILDIILRFIFIFLKVLFNIY